MDRFVVSHLRDRKKSRRWGTEILAHLKKRPGWRRAFFRGEWVLGPCENVRVSEVMLRMRTSENKLLKIVNVLAIVLLLVLISGWVESAFWEKGPKLLG